MTIDVRIPEFGTLVLAHLVLDFNGTLAIDVTAGTFGKARSSLANVDCSLKILKSGGEDRAKAAYVRRLGAGQVACIGNGRNDRRMLRTARLSLAVVQAEGASAETLLAADLVVPRSSMRWISLRTRGAWSPRCARKRFFVTRISDIIALHADLRIPLRGLQPPGRAPAEGLGRTAHRVPRLRQAGVPQAVERGRLPVEGYGLVCH